MIGETMLEDFFTSGRVADVILLIMAIEVALVFLLKKRGAIVLPFRTYFFGVIAGSLIIIAFRQALTGGSYLGIAVVLGLSFVAHLIELFSFVRRNNGNPIRLTSSYKFGSNSRT